MEQDWVAAVELLTPSETFWRVTYRLKTATEDLLELEKDIRSGGMDARVLREFRDAVDYVRKTAWALQELQERQIQQRDTATVRSLRRPCGAPPSSRAA